MNKYNNLTTNLVGVIWNDAKLNDVNLRGAKLFHPDLESRSVAICNIKLASNYNLAKFDPKVLESLKGKTKCKDR